MAPIIRSLALAVAVAASEAQALTCKGRDPVANVGLGQEPCEVPGPCTATHWTSRANFADDDDAEEDSNVCLRAPTCAEIQAASGPVLNTEGGNIEYGIGRKGAKYCDDIENAETRRNFPFTAVKIPNSKARYFRRNPDAKRYQVFCVTEEAEGEAPAKVKRVKNTRVKPDEKLFAAISQRAGCPGTRGGGDGRINPYDDLCGETQAFDAFKVIAGNPAGVPYPGSVETRTMDVGGMTREFHVYTPQAVVEKRASDPEYKVPMMVELHGLTGCAEYMPFYTKWISIASREGFVLVLPVGTQIPGFNILRQKYNPRGVSSWNAGLVEMPATTAGVEDNTFITDIVKKMTAADGIADKTRVYLAGHSNGAAMAQRVAYESPELFAAVATHALYLLSPFDQSVAVSEAVVDASALLQGDALAPALEGLTQGFGNFGLPAKVFVPGKQLPAYHVHGNADPVVSYAQCLPGQEGCGTPSPGAVGNNVLWGLINTCKSLFSSPLGKTEAVGDDGSFTLTHSECGFINQGYSSFVGDKEVEVKLLTLEAGSHLPYGGVPDATGAIETVDSTELAWEFIKDYQRKA